MSLQIVFCLGVLLLLLSPLVAAPDDWPMLRYDGQLTGHTDVKGNIISPAINDKVFAGAYEGLAVLRPDEKAGRFAIDGSTPIDPGYFSTHAAEWVETTGSPDDAARRLMGSDGAAVRFAKILPDVPGLQRVQFDGSGNPTDRGYLYAYDGGKEALVWRTEPETDMYGPNVLVLDADADGLPEVVVATHYRVMIYNGQTGVKKTELRWHGMRNYGFFGAFTVPGEKFPKFVVIADFISHIDVLDYDGKELKVRWRKDIETTIIRKQKITRPGPNPIADIDADGKPEITFNLYNDSGDRCWHVTAFDALTGDIRYDWPNRYLSGLADINGDGLPELFMQQTHGLAVPAYGPIKLIGMRGGKETVFWSHQRAQWQTTQPLLLPLTTATGAADGWRTVYMRDGQHGKECYVVTPGDEKRSNRPSLLVIARDGARWGVTNTITGPAGARLAMRATRTVKGKTELLLLWRSNGVVKQQFTADHASGEVVSWHQVPGPIPVPIVAHLRQGEGPTLIFQTALEEIAAYQKFDGAWKLRWRLPGRGMTNSAPSMLGLLAADVDGDGETEVVFARPSQTGEAELVAVNPDGHVKWAHTFAGCDGAMPVWNLGGLTLWTAGHFTTRDRLDIFASIRRSTMHSDEGFCISGKDGRELWHQEAVKLPGDEEWESSRGYAGSYVAVADMDGDGLDELVCAYPDRYWIADGKTGGLRTVVNTAFGIFPEMWVAYAVPLVADFQSNGKLQTLWGGNSYLTALLSADGKPLWYGKLSDGTSAIQGLGRADDTGRLLIGGPGYHDGFRCLDPNDGSLKWSFPLDNAWSGPAITADVNGDGLDEFLFTHGQTLYALNGKDGKANLVFKYDLPFTPDPPAFTDADGDGLPEILLGGSDGKVHLIGNAPR